MQVRGRMAPQFDCPAGRKFAQGLMGSRQSDHNPQQTRDREGSDNTGEPIGARQFFGFSPDHLCCNLADSDFVTSIGTPDPV
jgi:hypothetical protein